MTKKKRPRSIPSSHLNHEQAHLFLSKEWVQKAALTIYYQEKVERWKMGQELALSKFMFEKLFAAMKEEQLSLQRSVAGSSSACGNNGVALNLNMSMSIKEVEDKYIGKKFHRIRRKFNKTFSKEKQQLMRQELFEKKALSTEKEKQLQQEMLDINFPPFIMNTTTTIITRNNNMKQRSASTVKSPSSTKQKEKKSQQTTYEGKRLWTDVEKDTIIEGIQNFGLGKWAEIKKNNSVLFKNRTSGQIKDCFRTMKKKGEVGVIIKEAWSEKRTENSATEKDEEEKQEEEKLVEEEKKEEISNNKSDGDDDADDDGDETTSRSSAKQPKLSQETEVEEAEVIVVCKDGVTTTRTMDTNNNNNNDHQFYEEEEHPYMSLYPPMEESTTAATAEVTTPTNTLSMTTETSVGDGDDDSGDDDDAMTTAKTMTTTMMMTNVNMNNDNNNDERERSLSMSSSAHDTVTPSFFGDDNIFDMDDIVVGC